jgi:hypothetical protein
MRSAASTGIMLRMTVAELARERGHGRHERGR